MKKENEKLHSLPSDLKSEIYANELILNKWNQVTPLGKNEFICWVISAKKSETRVKRIKRTCEELLEGKKRPCCWPGCSHR